MQKIKLWADADRTIGYGHFFRTLALAEMLMDDFECHFYTKTPTEFQRKVVEEICQLHELPGDNSRFEIFLESLDQSDIVFLDNYFFSSSYQKSIKEKGCRLIVLSPNDKHHYADIVLNFVETDKTKFSIEPYTRIYAGIEWSILRRPFIEPMKPRIRRPRMITICFGGSDSGVYLEKTVNSLIKSEYEIHCICTDSVSQNTRYALEKLGVNLYVNIPAVKVADLFEKSRFAILSCSTICIEAIARDCTVVSGYIVSNQEKFYNLLNDNNLIYGIGNLNTFNFSSLPNILKRINYKNIKTYDFTNSKKKYISLIKSLCS